MIVTASWSSQVVAHLLDSKHAGYDFDGAWRRAITRHPPRGRDMGPERPSLFESGETLVTFFHRACADAWYGRRPGLAHFHPSLLAGADEGPERRGMSRRAQYTT